MKILRSFSAKLKKPLHKFVASRSKEMRFAERKMLLEQNLLYCHESGVTEEKYCDHDIIVSLTSYGRRIYSVWIAIESIMEQTMKANRIILWLDHSFENKPLPQSLRILEKRGLEIKYCDDIRSYTKLIPTLRLCPNDAIITIDDDSIYDVQLLEYLIPCYLADPSMIYANRVRDVQLTSHGDLLPYRKWKVLKQKRVSNLNFLTGVGGVLYPPHSLDPEVLNQSAFMDICKYADDVWFYAMALKKGTPICKVDTRNSNGEEYLNDPSVQDIGLYRINARGKRMNDIQLNAVFTKYNLYPMLKK